MGKRARPQAEQPDYQSYLLRMWRVNEGQGRWQISLESTRTGERRGFPSLEAMLDYLRLRTAVRADGQRENVEGGGW